MQRFSPLRLGAVIVITKRNKSIKQQEHSQCTKEVVGDIFSLFGWLSPDCGASPADSVAGIVEELAKRYVERGEYDKGVAVVEHLLSLRKAEVNDHLLEFLSKVYAKALFAKGKKAEAIQVLEKAITDYNGDWEKDLREQLAMYQEEMSRP